MGRQVIPDMNLPKHVFHRNDPLNKKEKTVLAKALKGSPATEETNVDSKPKDSKGAWSNKLHFAWDIILGATLKDEPERVDFADLWTEAVDGKSPDHSHTIHSDNTRWSLCTIVLQRKEVLGVPSNGEISWNSSC